MKRIDNDSFYEFIKKYDSDRERHFVGEVDYHLLCDDKPYEGAKSHREALRSVFEWLVEESIEDKESYRSMFGDDLADRILPLVYDIDKAQFSPLDSQVFFYCPNIVKTDYFDAGHEWYGSCCWSVYDKTLSRYVVMLVSATD